VSWVFITPGRLPPLGRELFALTRNGTARVIRSIHRQNRASRRMIRKNGIRRFEKIMGRGSGSIMIPIQPDRIMV
jgi:hypothetical protein